MVNEDGFSNVAPSTVALPAVEFQPGYVSRPGVRLVFASLATPEQVRDGLAHHFGLRSVDPVATPPAAEFLAQQNAHEIVRRDWIIMDSGASGVLVACARLYDSDQVAQIAQALDVDNVEVGMTTRQGLYDAVEVAFGDVLQDTAEQGLIRDHPRFSASFGVPRWQMLTAALAAAVLLIAAFVWPGRPLVVLTIVGNLLFLTGALFKASMSIIGLVSVRRRVPTEGIPPTAGQLPMYTILVPVLHEHNVVEQLLRHLGNLDYPQDRLQVLVLLEATDMVTIAAARATLTPDYMSLVIIPSGSPMTKPRACNYGLQLAIGEYTVIYDAEDRPEPDQLKRIVETFKSQPQDVVCVQAALNYYNAEENVLTRLFALEYSAWFDAMLPGMSTTGMPIPLGGTSNHFRTEKLRELGGWDPYNVTEDAELGLRVRAMGYQVHVDMAATTWEEACSDRGAWIRQRTRWIKGYMVTALVQLRQPGVFLRNFGWRGVATMAGLIAGTPLMFLAYPLLWVVTLLGLIGLVSVDSAMPSWLLQATFINALLGNFFAISITAWTGWHRHGWRIAGYALLNPIYWFMHSAAAWRALWQLVRSPFHWEKTPHGLTDTHMPEAAEASALVAEQSQISARLR
jgi:glycosyltransferase XagB